MSAETKHCEACQGDSVKWEPTRFIDCPGVATFDAENLRLRALLRECEAKLEYYGARVNGELRDRIRAAIGPEVPK